MLNKILSKLCVCMLLVGMVLGVVACGPKPGGNGDDDSWTTTGELVKDADGNVVFDNVQITLSTVVNGEDKGPFNRLVGKFNAQYRGKINVVVNNISQDSFEMTVSKQIANNSNAPDLIMSHQKGHQAFRNKKLIQPYDEIMEKSGITFDMKDYAAGLAKYTSLGSEYLYGVPIDAQSMVVYYNKKMLAKYSDKVPATREEFVALCEKVAKAENITPVAWSTSSMFFNQYVFPTAILQNGGTLYRTDDLKADWTSGDNKVAFENAIEVLHDMMVGDHKIAKYNDSTSNALSSFVNNKALFYFNVPWYNDSIKETYRKTNNIETVDMVDEYVGGASMAGWFAKDSANPAANKIYGDSHFFAISKTVTDITKKAAICEFVKWFTTNVEAGIEWATAGHTSVSKAIIDSDAYKSNAVVVNYLNKFYPNIDHFECIGNTPFYDDIAKQLDALFVSAMSARSSSEYAQLIADAQKRINDRVDFLNSD